jgi:PadR family transcriptional regulator PadR
MPQNTHDQEWKKGSAELLVLSLLEDQARHGYDISKLIQIRSGGALKFHVTSLYPLLHRLERLGYVSSSWGTSEAGRRRKHYAITPAGRVALADRQEQWSVVASALRQVWQTAQQPPAAMGWA